MSIAPKVLVTGASGFVGRAVIDALIDQPQSPFEVLAAGRGPESVSNLPCKYVGGLELTSDNGWLKAFAGVDVVVHCAARVHIMKDAAGDPLAEFRRVNVEGTLRLAKMAAQAGARKFIFLSSVKVHGESTTHREPFRDSEELAPKDPYAVSKVEAETELQVFCESHNLDLVVVRPPLVYGPGVKGNFLSLLKVCRSSIPLPFGALANRRSMIYVHNLAHFLVCCISSPEAARQAFLVSDGEDLSMAELLSKLRWLCGNKPLLIPVPVLLFRLVGALTRKGAVVDRLAGSLQVNSSKAGHLLGWVPPYSVAQGLKATVDDFLAR